MTIEKNISENMLQKYTLKRCFKIMLQNDALKNASKKHRLVLPYFYFVSRIRRDWWNRRRFLSKWVFTEHQRNIRNLAEHWYRFCNTVWRGRRFRWIWGQKEGRQTCSQSGVWWFGRLWKWIGNQSLEIADADRESWRAKVTTAHAKMRKLVKII